MNNSFSHCVYSSNLLYICFFRNTLFGIVIDAGFVWIGLMVKTCPIQFELSVWILFFGKFMRLWHRDIYFRLIQVLSRLRYRCLRLNHEVINQQLVIHCHVWNWILSCLGPSFWSFSYPLLLRLKVTLASWAVLQILLLVGVVAEGTTSKYSFIVEKSQIHRYILHFLLNSLKVIYPQKSIRSV